MSKLTGLPLHQSSHSFASLFHQPDGQPSSTGYQPTTGRHRLCATHCRTLHVFLVRETVFWAPALSLGCSEQSLFLRREGTSNPFPAGSHCEVRQRGRRMEATVTSTPVLVYKREAFLMGQQKVDSTCVPQSAWHPCAPPLASAEEQSVGTGFILKS